MRTGMDLITSCKGKLAEFRIKELKDVLNQLGLSKQGKKQDLVDRILAILSDERGSGMWAKKNAVGKHEVAKLENEGSGAPDLASKGQAASDSSNVRLKEEIEDSYPTDKIRCLCGSSLQADSMIKCEDPRCQVWQHIGCVIIPEKPMEGVLPAPPDIFYCELCRLSRADPFWMTVANPLYPVKLTTTSVPTDGTNPTQSIEKTFQLTRADKDLLLKQEYDVQAWCMLLNDKVTFRMQWPLYADLQVNGVLVRAINRPGTQLLGANGRDDGPVITPFTRDGINKISLTGCDSRVFSLGVRIVKRRTVQQILNLIPKESDDEQFEEALSRVRRCVGGTEMENADSDSDLEIVADFIPVNLRCPMQNSGEDVADIEVKPDGSWRAKAESDHRELGDLGMWHFPDGTLCAPMHEEVKSRLEAFKHVKQEGVSEGHANLKLGIRKNRNGLWEVSKPEDLHALSSAQREVAGMADDASVNQDGGGNFDFSTNNGIELDSMSLNIDPTYGFTNHNSTPLGNAEVIVLSDSEEENDILISSVYKNNQTDTNGVAFPLPQHGIPDPYPEEPALGTGASSCLGLFNTNDDEFGMPIWSLPPGSQAGPSFQLFGSDADVSDALLDLQHGSINCPTSMNDYSFTLEPAMGSAGPVPESSIDHSNADLNDRLINNPLPFGGDDPPLQLFLPTRPSDALMQPNLRDQPDESEDWVSLRLGGGGTSGQSAAANGVKSQQQLQSKERPMDSLTDTGMCRFLAFAFLFFLPSILFFMRVLISSLKWYILAALLRKIWTLVSGSICCNNRELFGTPVLKNSIPGKIQRSVVFTAQLGLICILHVAKVEFGMQIFFFCFFLFLPNHSCDKISEKTKPIWSIGYCSKNDITCTSEHKNRSITFFFLVEKMKWAKCDSRK
ncbi:hypothetical protein HYC85_031107 [Camellia sinensis]|uniref:SAP domain-containing protein n=1 Tax=Camellia sinensis TaxID=4442 RepID=A0A7J7FTL3_CAMSI|nr:hypothetical protein HYC85_031107 [Camellia sinensis]